MQLNLSWRKRSSHHLARVSIPSGARAPRLCRPFTNTGPLTASMTRRQTGNMDPDNQASDRHFHQLGRIIAVLELGAGPRRNPVAPPLLRPGLHPSRRPPRTLTKAPAVSPAPPTGKGHRRPVPRNSGPVGHRAAGNGRRRTAASHLRRLGQPGPERLGFRRPCGNRAARPTATGRRRSVRRGLPGTAQGTAGQPPTGTPRRGKHPLPLGPITWAVSCPGRAPATTRA